MGRVTVGGKLGERAKIRAQRTDRTMVLPMIKESALADFGPDEDRDPLVIHPSEMAKADWCIRATYWRISGRPEPDRKFNFILENIFAEGNGIHAKFQSWLRKTGKLYGAWECLSCGDWWTGISGELQDATYPDGRIHCHIWEYREIRMNLPGVSLIAGRADGGIDHCLVECKSIGVGTLRVEAPAQLKRYYNSDAGLYDLDKFWKDLARPLPGHVRQANIYLWLARECGLPFAQMNFIYEFKPNQQVKEFVITLSEDILEPLLDRATVIETCLAQGTPPDCEFGGCKQCRAYEEGKDVDGPSQGSEPRPDGKARRVVTGGRQGGREAGPDAASAPPRRTAGGAARPDRGDRPRADGAVRAAEPVGRVPRRAAQRGGDRRVVRRQDRGQADRARPDQGAG